VVIVIVEVLAFPLAAIALTLLFGDAVAEHADAADEADEQLAVSAATGPGQLS